LTIEYEILLDQDMLINAVSKEEHHFKWLFFVWATRKNYFGNRNNPDALFIMFDLLFDMIIRQWTDKENKEENITRHVKEVLDWKIDCRQTSIENNIIRCLLVHHLDDIAVEYMGEYNYLLNKDLLINCVKHGNVYFLQKALV
jgi:hypothetical protein